MDCIYCGGKTSVINSRRQQRNKAVWRRRECRRCGGVFTTEEQAAYLGSIVYIGAQGHIEPFSRPKLFASIYEACKHQKQAAENADALTATVLARIVSETSGAKIERSNLISVISEVLRRFDKAAAVSYTAYHQL